MASENLALIKEENTKEKINLPNKAIQNINREKIKKVNNLFCENCSLQFDKKIIFDLHLSLVHGKKIEINNEEKKNSLAELDFLPGNPGGKILASKKTLTIHKAKIHDISNNPEAVQQFSKLNNQNEKQFQCKLCDAKFASNFRLKEHIAGVHEKSIKCDICSKNFQTQQKVTRHIKNVHEGKKSHECLVCYAKYSTSSNLNYHIRSVHEEIKRLSCTICKSTFKQKQGLSKHIEIVHEGKKKRFGCSLCDVRFSQKGDVNRHIEEVHEGKKKFECEVCSMRFVRNAFLTAHITNQHEEIKDLRKNRFACAICEKIFGNSGHLTRHIKTVHQGDREKNINVLFVNQDLQKSRI